MGFQPRRFYKRRIRLRVLLTCIYFIHFCGSNTLFRRYHGRHLLRYQSTAHSTGSGSHSSRQSTVHAYFRFRGRFHFSHTFSSTSRTSLLLISLSHLESMKLTNNANLQKFKSKKQKKEKNQQTTLNMNMTVCFLVGEANRKGNCCGGSGCKASETKEVAVAITKADQALLHFP